MFSKIIPIIIAYFLGSIPSAYLIAKNKGIDITSKVENGRLGTVSVSRNVGKFAGALVGIMDFCKGALSIIIADRMSGGEGWVMVLAGAAAIIGHNWSIFLHFMGGKGAATTFGNLFYLLPIPFLLAGFITAVPSYFLKQKSRFSIPGKNKDFKTSDFLTSILFLLTFIFALFFEAPLIIAFSPIIFSVPIILKKN
jgi:acyl-phosphate glycerol 3-phosphate acyltransferase